MLNQDMLSQVAPPPDSVMKEMQNFEFMIMKELSDSIQVCGEFLQEIVKSREIVFRFKLFTVWHQSYGGRADL